MENNKKKNILAIIGLLLIMCPLSVNATREASCVYESSYTLSNDINALVRIIVEVDENNKLTYINQSNSLVTLDPTWLISDSEDYIRVNSFIRCPNELTENECANLAETEKELFCPKDIILISGYKETLGKVRILPTFDEAEKDKTGNSTVPLKEEDSYVKNLIYQSSNNEGDGENDDESDEPDAPIVSENERLNKCVYGDGITIEYYSDGSVYIPNIRSEFTSYDISYSFMGDPNLYATGNCPDIWAKTELENTIKRIYIYTESLTDDDCDDYSNFVTHYNVNGIVEDAGECENKGTYIPEENKELYLCEENGVKQSFQIIGYLLFCLKIAIPLILIGLGILDFSKAMISEDDKVTKETAIKFAKRIISGVVIFFIPTVLNFIFSLVEGIGNIKAKYEGCTACLFYPNDETKCDFEKVGFTEDE